ncbi:D-hexose-6-phosphate mutarotase [Gallionella capsiferriformans]|uniref:Putative glucose-6-phosphate 1-epimerase n=1 Tax=Gallionella capsiferriformans (strain ES-2) TaxID=395494 RepID=D9SJ66_GALCS|nr:D-hexose-6-phosphate mutarotase [Gallionella capsiferriformans]ADL54342.1 Aldose 1-epimerase [Gallionella capsiferriformans ES-2]
MTTALNSQFGIKGQLVFNVDASGLIVAEIDNALGRASLCLQGAHLMSWQPKSQAVPVVWLSRDTKPAVGKSIRGGAPVCWPWFGAHASEAGFPGHGFARTVPWRVIESGSEPDGATRLTLRLVPSDKTRAQWLHECNVDLTVIVGETLRMEMTTENTGATNFVIGEALHTYFQISDIGAIRVTGLEGTEYWDKVGGSNLRRQDGAITFNSEVDRVYINTGSECVIHDDKLARRIHIAKSGSQSTVVWTPWVEKANKMGDMGQPDGWREMVCVESVNAIENVVTVAAGTRHTMIVEYRAESV